ncbi:hypothetical protein Tco_0112681, partial [Tanacetum coccineum]
QYHDDHHDDAHVEGENSAKRQKTSKKLSLDQETVGDEIPSEEASLVFLAEISGSDTKWFPTSTDHK